MAFFDSSSSSKNQKTPIEQEIDLLVKAKGLKPGEYKFYPNPDVRRTEGSIINGKVKGKFTMSVADIDKFIVLERDDFSERAWKKLCSALGFKYHDSSIIDKFTIIPSSIDVDVTIITPLEEP